MLIPKSDISAPPAFLQHLSLVFGETAGRRRGFIGWTYFYKHDILLGLKRKRPVGPTRWLAHGFNRGFGYNKTTPEAQHALVNEDVLASGMKTNDWMEDHTLSHPCGFLFRAIEVPLLRSCITATCFLAINMPLLWSWFSAVFQIVIQSPIVAKA